ncbi:MAG: pilus assembly protein PilM [Sarcina sp.]
MVGKLDEAMQTGLEQKGIEIETSKADVKKKRKIKPLPKIKDIKLLSIDIGSKYIKIIEAKRKKDVIQISSALKIESPSDIIDNGELRNLPNITNALKMAFMKWHVATKDVSFTSSASTMMSREITIADTDEITVQERQMLVENELRQYLPINLADYQIQFTDAGKVEENGVMKQKVLVVVYPIKLIKSYLGLVSDVGNKYRPCSLDVTNNSLQKFFNHVKTINGQPVDRSKVHLFIDMGRTTFNASIIASGKLQFMRSINASQDEIDRAIGLRVGKSYDEAEILKMEKCNLVGENLTDEQMEINEVTKVFVNQWTEDIARILQFYGNKEQQRVDKIYIYGGGAKLTGLADYMEEKLNVETEKIEDFDGVDFGKNVNVANVDQFINTIGTIIRF